MVLAKVVADDGHEVSGAQPLYEHLPAGLACSGLGAQEVRNRLRARLHPGIHAGENVGEPDPLQLRI